jgi:Ca2+-binding EF-hand superfamily protein
MADRDLTEDEVADLKEAFAMFDINGDGRFQFSNLGCSFPAVCR